MKRKFLSLILLILMISCTIGIADGIKTTHMTLGNNTTNLPTVSVTINYIKELDPLDVGSKPDWYYKIDVYNGSDYRDPHTSIVKGVKDEPDETNPNIWKVNKTHDFKTYTCTTRIVITLMEDDTYDIIPSCDDIADICNETNEDKDPKVDCLQDTDGRALCILYDIDKKSSLTKVSKGHELEGSGNDGEGNSGSGEGSFWEDDAEISITIEDNYEPISLNLEIQNRDEKFEENDNVRPDKLLTFECTIEGGWPPYTYNLFPKAKQSDEMIVEIDNSSSYTFPFTYTDCHGAFTPIIWVWGFDATSIDMNSENVHFNVSNEIFEIEDVDTEYFIMEEFFVNQRPIAKLSKNGLNYDASESDDPDRNNLQYKFEEDGIEQEYWSNSYIYTPSSILSTVRVKVRDRPLGGDFGDGLESNGWATTVKTKSKQLISTGLADFLLQNCPILYHFFQKVKQLKS